jgi:hypothetical protein
MAYDNKSLSNILVYIAAWGYHRQGSCQAGFSASVTKVRQWQSLI